MKMKLLPLAVSAAVALPGVVLADGPTVYGKLNVSMGQEKIDDGKANTGTTKHSSDAWEVRSNDSRIGVKGDAKINDQLKATYVAEWGISADGTDAANTDLQKLRNRSVGLAGAFGAVDVGQFDTPTKTAQGKVDQFNDMTADLKFALVGDERKSNIIQYTTPAMSGVQAKLAIMPGEQFQTDTTAQPKQQHGLVDTSSMSVSYTQGGLYAALAHDSKMQSKLWGGVKDITSSKDLSVQDGEISSIKPVWDINRLVGQYTMGNIQLGAIYQMAKSASTSYGAVTANVEDDLEQKGYLLSAAYTMDKTVFKAELTSAKDDDKAATNKDMDARIMAVGVDQKLSTQTTVYGYYNKLTYKPQGALAGTTSDQTRNNLEVGVVHAF